MGAFEAVNVVVDAQQLEMHLEELKKQGLARKPHSCNFSTLVFIKINNSQPIDFNVNQIMKSIICHDHTCDLEVFSLTHEVSQRFDCTPQN
jgi:hypothetical protein